MVVEAMSVVDDITIDGGGQAQTHSLNPFIIGRLWRDLNPSIVFRARIAFLGIVCLPVAPAEWQES